MAMIISNQQRIFYRYEGERGAFLLLHHGLFGSHQDWYDAGYVKALAGEFRLIIPDSRGHGRSDHPVDSSLYRLRDFADDMVAVMDELQIRNLHFLGYSLGALVGLELLMRHPDRVRIIMLAGESPFVDEQARERWRALAGLIRQEGLSAVKQRLQAENLLAGAPPAEEAAADREAAVALLEALASEEFRPDGRISVDSPVAMFAGGRDPAADRIREARKRIYRARFVAFPEMTHAGLFEQREALLAEVFRLLRSGRRPTGPPGGQQAAEASDRGGRAGDTAPHLLDTAEAGESAMASRSTQDAADEQGIDAAHPPNDAVAGPPREAEATRADAMGEGAAPPSDSRRVAADPPEAHDTQGGLRDMAATASSAGAEGASEEGRRGEESTPTPDTATHADQRTEAAQSEHGHAGDKDPEHS